MTVPTYTRPNNTAQSGSAYKSNLDGAAQVFERGAGSMFAAHEQTVPVMTVRVDAGAILNGVTLTEVAAQSTGTITAPVTNPRIDRVVIDILTGTVSVITGAEAASPSAPAIPAGKLPIAQVALATSTTTITNALITDERVAIASVMSVAPTSFAFIGDISPSQITADQNNYDPTGLSTASVLRLSTDASRNITGLAGGSDGRVLQLHNVGSNALVLKDESASSTAANRFALNSDVTINADQTVWLHYDSTTSRWRVSGAPGTGNTGCLHVQDQKASGTAGGTSASAAWTIRDLNTVVVNTISGASLASNQITLPAGTYRVWGVGSLQRGGGLDRGRHRLRNVTDATTAALSNNWKSGDGVVSPAFVGRFTLAASKTFELQYWVTTGEATTGLGIATTSGEVEVYGDVFILQE